MFRSPFDELTEDHASLRAEMQGLQHSVRALTQGNEGAPGSGGKLIQDELGVLRKRLHAHFRREEECVFPEGQRMVSEGAEGADVFGNFFQSEAEEDISAHQVLLRRVNEMLEQTAAIETSGLDEGSGRRLLAAVNLTLSLLERHAGKEDRLIFPLLQRSLDIVQLDQIAERMQQLVSDRDLASGEEDGPGYTQLGG